MNLSQSINKFTTYGVLSKIALVSILAATLLWLILHFFISNLETSNTIKFSIILLYFIGFILIISLHGGSIVFDPKDYTSNDTKEELVFKFRMRALLFNNLSVIILFFIVIIIIISFYYIIIPPRNSSQEQITLTVALAAITTTLIFLVHIAFRVFKYILRVAAFYNAKADAIEFHIIDSSVGLEKLMELFTPSNYDISDLIQPSILGNTTSTSSAPSTNSPISTTNSAPDIMIQKGTAIQ